MQQQKIKIITINREYAASGRTVAKALSEGLNIPWYDWDFVRLTAEESGYTEEQVRKNSEDLSLGTDIANRLFSNASYTSSQDSVFRAQRKVMIELTAKAPCIMVGRSSNFIYRDAGIPSFDILLHADLEYRLKRAGELGENGSTDLLKYVMERDAKRHHHYKHYTKSNFEDCYNYDLCIDVGRIGLDSTCQMLIALLKDRI